MRKLCCLFFAFCFLASAENVKLYIKDGSYQLVREYKVESDRVSFYSLDRDDWEEVPALAGRSGQNQGRNQGPRRRDSRRCGRARAEKKAERAARKEVASVPQDPAST